MTLYLDASAAAKLMLQEAESDALTAYLDSVVDQGVVSSALLETELRRFAVRLDLAQQTVTEVLSRLDLIDASRALFHQAGLLPGQHLRSLDALHLATAVQVGASTVVAYDRRLIEAATSMGLGVSSPA